MPCTPIEKMKRKIAALLRHSKGTNNLKEAASFAAKARELMEAYAIEVAPSEEEYERVGETCVEGNKLGMTWFNTGYKSEPYVHLIAELAEFYGCHPVFKRGEINRVRLYGRESARVTCCEMFKFLLKECERLAVEWSRDYGWTKRESKIEVISAMGYHVQMLQSNYSPLKSHVPAIISPVDEAKALDTSHGDIFYTSASASMDAIKKAGKVSLSPQVKECPVHTLR